MMAEITDPRLLSQLEGQGGGGEVTDPALLQQLDASYQAPAGSAGGAFLRGVPVLGAYIPQAEAAIRATMQPLTGVGQPGESWSERYAANMPVQETAAQQYDINRPIASTALKVGGGTAALAPIGATALGARALGLTGGNLMGRIGASAASGGAISAADAAARSEDIEASAKMGVLGGAAGPLIGRYLGGGRAVASGGTPALPAAEIKKAGSEMYNIVRDEVRDVGFKPGMSSQMMQQVRGAVSVDFREMRAEETHKLVTKIGKARDVTDLVDIREAAGKLGREAVGNEKAAAYLVRDHLDNLIDGYVPGISERLKWADRNYAIAGRAQAFEDQVEKAALAARGSRYGVREGTAVRKAAKQFLEPGAKFVSPEIRAAAEGVSMPGGVARTLQSMSVADPSRGYLSLLGPILSGAVNPMSIPFHVAGAGVGYGSGKAYDAMMRNRVRALSEALRREAPATQAQPGYQAPQLRQSVPSLLGLTGIPFGLQY